MDGRTEAAISFFGNSILSSVILIAICYIVTKAGEPYKDSPRVYIIKSLFIITTIFILNLFFLPHHLYFGIALIVLVFLLRYYSIPLGISYIQDKVRLNKLKKWQDKNSLSKLNNIQKEYNLNKEYEEKITYINHIHYIIINKSKNERNKIADKLFSKIKCCKFILTEPSPQNTYLYSFLEDEHNYQLLLWVRQMFYLESMNEIEKIVRETKGVYTLAEIVEREDVSRETSIN